ncbi:MAG: hypothetical protein SPG48_09615 [Treponema sp.]|nr:hypothetical protein [Treponema sp.]
MCQSITSGDFSTNTQIGTINNNYYNKKFSYDLRIDDSRKKFFQNCVYEIISSEKIEIISIRQLKTKLAIKILENSANSDDNISMEDILPKFNEFLNSEIFEKEEGYKISII